MPAPPTIGKIGGSMGLNFSGWASVEFPGGFSMMASTGNLTASSVTAPILTFGPGGIGQIGNDATDIKLDCYSGADFVVTMVAGAGESITRPAT